MARCTSVISVIFTELRFRASHSMTGTLAFTDRASCTLLTVCGNSPLKPLTPR